MAENNIIDQIPGFEVGAVKHVYAADGDQVHIMAAQQISELLNRWNTSVAFFSLGCHGEQVAQLVENRSSSARLYTVDQKNPDLNIILRKAQGMVHRKFVRAIILEGIPGKPDAAILRRIEQWSRSNRCAAVLISTTDES